MRKRIWRPNASARRSRCPRLGAKTAKQLLQHELAGGLHAVDLAVLRDGAAVLGEAGRQDVAVEDRDVLVEVRQDPRGQQPGDARTDDQGVLAVLAGCRPPARRLAGGSPRRGPRSRLQDSRRQDPVAAVREVGREVAIAVAQHALEHLARDADRIVGIGSRDLDERHLGVAGRAQRVVGRLQHAVDVAGPGRGPHERDGHGLVAPASGDHAAVGDLGDVSEQDLLHEDRVAGSRRGLDDVDGPVDLVEDAVLVA